MHIVEQVLSDARSEFMIVVKNVLSSLSNRHTERFANGNNGMDDRDNANEGASTSLQQVYTRSKVDSEAYVRKFISEGKVVNLNCTKDVKDLIVHLFKEDELLEIGFASVNVMQSHPSRKPSTAVDNNSRGRPVDIHFIRPTLKDASILKNNIQYDRGEYFPVVCLPEVSDMFPTVLQNVLGENFTVADEAGGNKTVRLFSCNIHMAPIETCVLSMFISGAFEEFHGDGDPTVSWFFAKAVEYLEYRLLDGAIPNLTCLGHISRFVTEALVRGRRDCAADAIVYGTERSNTLSDVPFLTEELNKSKSRNRRSPRETTGNDVTVDKEHFKERKKILGASTVIDEAVFMDRIVDMVTPMCLNFTYEGFLDNVFGVVQQQICIPSGIVNGHTAVSSGVYDQYRNNFFTKCGSSNTSDDSLLQLSSPLYKEIRWLNYADAGKHLHQRALQVHKGYERGDLATIGEMGEFVKKFKTLQKEHSELAIHVNLMTWLSSLINGDLVQLLHQLEDSILQSSPDVKLEDSKLASITAKFFNKGSDPCVSMFLDLIYCNAEIQQVYRLLILLSQTRDGIKTTNLHSIKKAIVDQYGFQQMLVFHKLEKLGLIRVGETPDGMRWNRLCKKLNLLVDRETSVSDYSVIFGGYAPISLRLLQLILLSQNITTLRSELGLLNCPVTVLKQKDLLQREPKGHASSYKLFGMIGGVTLGEIASIAFLNQKKSLQLLLLTTNVVNVNTLINVEA